MLLEMGLRRYSPREPRSGEVRGVRYRGTLEVERGSGRLPVELVLSERSFAVTSHGDLLGTYDIGDVEAERLTGDRFDLRIGAESFVFTADDAIRFSYEGLPTIASARARRVDIVDVLRQWWGRVTPAASPVKPPTVAGPSEPGEPIVAVQGDLTTIDLSASDPVAAARGPAQAGATCIGIRADGTPCGSSVIGAGGFCYAHDPDRAEERRRMRVQVTVAAERVRRSSHGDLDGVLERLERAVAEVHDGTLDPQTALAMASLARAMVDTIEVAKSQERRMRRRRSVP